MRNRGMSRERAKRAMLADLGLGDEEGEDLDLEGDGSAGSDDGCPREEDVDEMTRAAR
jgi:hypothetical protein